MDEVALSLSRNTHGGKRGRSSSFFFPAFYIKGAAAAASAASLLNRYGRGPGGSTAGGAAPPAGGGMLAGTCGAPTGMVNLNQRRTNLTGSSMNRAGGLKDDYCSPQDGTTSSSSSTSSDPNVAFLELYHRCVCEKINDPFPHHLFTFSVKVQLAVRGRRLGWGGLARRPGRNDERSDGGLARVC